MFIRKRFLLLALALGGLSCVSRGSDPAPALSPDGATGRDAASAGPGGDLLPASDLGLDPATCPVGVSDGCCPLLRYGGSDPDCPRLDCARLSQGATVALDPPGVGSGRNGAGQVGLAWTGRELALAWTYATPKDQYKVYFERRGYDGALSYGPVDSALPAAAAPVVHGPTVLVYEPSRKLYALAHTASQLRYAALGLDASGMATWGASLGELCNAIWLFVDGFSTGSQWVLGQQNMTCAGSTYQPRVDLLDFSGMGQQTFFLGDGKKPDETLFGVFAYEPAAQRLLTVYSRWTEASLGARYLELSPIQARDGYDMLPGTPGSPYERLGLAFDGQRYGVVIEERVSYSVFRQSFRVYDPAGKAWVGDSVPFGGPREILTPSMLWTGDGFLVAAMSFDGPDTPVGNVEKFTSMVYSFTPAGALRESFAVDADPAVYPKLMWAGGRVALTWVRVKGSTTEHYLRYLSCP